MTCSKCNDTGWFQYDHNHSQPCYVCCKHDKGFWQLLKHYGEDNGKWCCLAGCGYLLTFNPDISPFTSEHADPFNTPTR